jgi:hypothetical protein
VSVGSLRLSKATGNGQYTGSVSMIIFRGAIVADVNEKSFLLRSRSVETTIFAQHACVDSFAISSNGKTTIVGLKTTKRTRSTTESDKDQKTKRFSNLVFDLQCLICGTCAPHQKSPIYYALSSCASTFFLCLYLLLLHKILLSF